MDGVEHFELVELKCQRERCKTKTKSKKFVLKTNPSDSLQKIEELVLLLSMLIALSLSLSEEFERNELV